jgi:photosystem II stability/assembly factor-like uncharacterized protein
MISKFHLVLVLPPLLLGMTTAPLAGERWRPVGPAAGQPTLAIALDPVDPSILYAATPAGLFRSDDRGERWRLIGEGLRYSGFQDAVLEPAPFEPGKLFLVRGDAPLWVSGDRGGRWHVVNPSAGPLSSVLDVAADPVQPSVVYAAFPSVFKSRDGGRTWTSSTSGFGAYVPAALGVDPAAPETLYAGAFRFNEDHLDLRVYRSADGGATWDALTAPGELRLAPVTDLLPHQFVVVPGTPRAIYLATQRGGVIRSLDGGATWGAANDGLDPFDIPVDVEGIAVDPSEPSTLYAAVADLFHARGVYKTIDRGDHWVRAGSGIPEGVPVHDVVVDPAEPSRIYAATGVGVFVSEDAGGTWRPRASGMASEVSSSSPDPHAPGRRYASTTSAGPLRTTDGGVTWEPFATALAPETRSQALDLAAAPCAPGVFYLSTAGEHFGQQPPEGFLFKSADGGETWAPADAGLVEGIPRLLVDGRLCSTLFAISRGRALLRSDDGAASWRRLGTSQVYDLVVDPEDPDLVYAGTESSVVPGEDEGFCRSADGGATWTCPPTPFGVRPTTFSLAAVPGPSPVLYAASGDQEVSLFVSRDRGTSWRAARGAGLPAERITDLAVDRRDGSTLWAGTAGGGVFRSRDGGEDWTPISQGLGSLQVNELSFGPDGLYAATAGGLYRLDEAAGAGDPLPPDELPWIEDPTYPGFRFKVQIEQGGGESIAGIREAACLPETVCFSGALPGRSELFVRIVGPKPSGWLWPTLVKFSTSRIEVWIQELETGRLRYYELRGARPGFDELPGLFDRFGFQP